MLVLAMEFSRCAERPGGSPMASAGPGPRRPSPRRWQPRRATLRPFSRSATGSGGCPFKTEQKDPDLSPTRSEDESCDGRACSRSE
jgi:hypothetical protein